MAHKKNTATRVLLVDDDRQEYLLIGYLLSEAKQGHYSLIWCQDFERALQYIENDNENLVVLMDYHWNGYNMGKQFLRRAKLKNSRVPIIAMTDEIEDDIDHNVIRYGASDYLTKNHINAALLERTLRYAIERKQIEEKLDYLAYYDHLTNLPNRTLFLDRLRQAITIGKRDEHPFTLMFIDLNSFKAVNDNYGHDVGDKLLKNLLRASSSSVERVIR